MLTKDKSVKLKGLHVKMREVLMAVEKTWESRGEEPVITAGTEAIDSEGNFLHSMGSLHPFGRALDFRTRYFGRVTQIMITNELKQNLGRHYDVILHKTHIHIEYDPK